MTEEINQPTPQLTREQSLTPLLREATDLLALFLSSEETRDLEPLISAQALLESAADLLSPAAQATGIAWARQFPVVCINRADLTEFGFANEQIATLFTDEVMRYIADDMQGSYHVTHPFWEDFTQAIRTVLHIDVQPPSAGTNRRGTAKETERIHQIDWEKQFPTTSISRTDLKEAGFTDAHIETLTDEDMACIASKMDDMYYEEAFWEDLKIATTLRLEFGNLYGGM